jgi:hypothetical protein
MREALRWRLATLVNRLPGQCWADLVSWVLDRLGKRRYYNRMPWQPRTWSCTKDAVENGRCYCGKLTRDGSIEGGAR